MQSLRIFPVDDNQAFLDLAARELATDTRIQIVGCVRSAEEALVQMQRVQPDLVLLDISLPQMNGLEATRQIKVWPGAPRVVLMTILDTPAYHVAGMEAGADGLIAKEEFDTQISPLIETLFGNLTDMPESAG